MMHGTKRAVRQALKTWKRGVAVVAVSIFTWTAFIVLTRPAYSLQLLSADATYLWTEVLPTLVWNQNATYGAIGVLLPMAIALLVGLVTVTTGVSLLQSYHASGSLTGVAGSLVGFSAAGCASCGAGVLTLLGLSGGVALLPFNGLGVQALSIVILIGALEYTGRSGACTIEQ